MLWDLFMLFLHIFEVLGTLLVGGVAFFAWKGWKREIRGQTEYKLAVDLLTATYRFRDAIDSVRSPLTFAHEMIAEDKDRYNPVKDIEKFERMEGAYQKRWERVVEAQYTILGDSQVAEAIWGEEAKNLFQELLAHSNDLHWAIENRLRIINPVLSAEHKKSKERLSKEIDAILNKHDEKDNFSNNLKRLITEIENYLKPKLKS